MPRVALDEFDAVYCRTTGAGEHALLVLGAAWLEADTAALAPEGRIVHCDLRGRGRSTPRRSPAPPTLEGDVADIETLRRALGLERLSLLGWSYEAAVALRYALAHPDRVERVVLVAPLPARKIPHWESFRRRYAERVAKEDLARIEALGAGGATAQRTPAYRRAVLAAMVRGYGGDVATADAMRGNPFPPPHTDPEEAALLRRVIHDSMGDWDWRGELAALDIPVLVVHGAEDSMPRAVAEEYAERLPDARLVVLEGAAHFPWLERPAEFFTAVNEFLDAP